MKTAGPLMKNEEWVGEKDLKPNLIFELEPIAINQETQAHPSGDGSASQI